MQIINVAQGSQEWKDLRAKHFCASEAAAMLGLSDKVARNELLHMKATGSEKEFSDWVQEKILDKGHEYEEAARPHAEAFLGEQLYPVTGTDVIDGLPILASFDGLTMAETVSFEHKRRNKILEAYIAEHNDLPDTHWPQVEQQLLLMGNGKCLFTMSDGEDEGAVRLWYESKPERRARLIPGWKQFAEDVKNYQHVEVIPAAVAAAQTQLPAVSVIATGNIAIRDNLSEFGACLRLYVDGLNMKPETDQEFADLEAAGKNLRKAQEAIVAAKANARGQIGEFDAMMRLADEMEELSRSTALMIENTVKAEKQNRKNKILDDGKKRLVEYVAELNADLGKSYIPPVNPDFAGAIKGMSNFANITNAVDTCLANAKIDAKHIYDRIKFNLATYAEIAGGFEELFPDLANLVLKLTDDFTATLESRKAKKIEGDRLKREQAERDEAARKAAEEDKRQADAVAVAQKSATPEPTTNSAPSQPAEEGAAAPVAAHIGKVGGVIDASRVRAEINALLDSMNTQQLVRMKHYAQDVAKAAA